MAVTQLRFNITSSWDGNGVRGAARALGNVGREVDRVNRNFGSGGSGLQLWQKAAIALAPALFTLGKAGLAGLGGITALAAAVGGAVAPFAALAITAAKNAGQMGAAGKAYESATSKVKTAWMDLAKKTAPLTLKPMTDVLEGMATAIPKLEPLVRKMAPVMADMGKSIRSWLEGPGFERLVQNLTDYGVPAFRNLVAAGKDFLATAGIGFRQFLPVALDISEALKRGAANLRDWAEGGGFARFLADVKREAPAVKDFLRELGTSVKNIGRVMNDIGPAELSGLANLLEQFNKVDVDGWKSFLLTLAGLKIGAGLLSLLGALAGLRAGGLQITGAGALAAAAAALSAAGATLLSAAAALSSAAAALSAAGGAAGLGGLIAALGGLLSRLGGTQTVTVTITPADADAKLSRIKAAWDGLKAAGTSITFTVTLNASAFTAAASGILSTWAAVTTRAATPATFRVIFNPGSFTSAAQQVIARWQAVRAAAAFPVTFRALANPGNVLMVAATLISTWARVRAAAAVPAIFRASAFPGNVPAVAAQLIAAWAGVRAAAAVVPRFTATASAGNVPSVSNQIVSAWRRVTSMPRSWSATARVNGSSAVSSSRQVVSAWRQVLAMPRSWTASATVNSGGAVAGANAVRAAWQSVLSLPRSVTFTVNVVTKKTGGEATGGPAAGIPGFARGGSWGRGGWGRTFRGRVSGRGGPMSDKISTMLSRGEWVIRQRAVKAWGPGFMKYINSAKPRDVRRGGKGGSSKYGSVKPMSIGAGGGAGPGDTVIKFHGKVYALGDAEFEDLVVRATAEAKRRRRL